MSSDIVGWELSDHACKNCMGRVLVRKAPEGSEMRCAECGSKAIGQISDLCWCGVTVGNHGTVFECFRNKEITNISPHEILVRERRK